MSCTLFLLRLALLMLALITISAVTRAQHGPRQDLQDGQQSDDQHEEQSPRHPAAGDRISSSSRRQRFQQESSCRQRKEIHDLTPREWDRLVRAFRLLKQTNTEPEMSGGQSEDDAGLQEHARTKVDCERVLKVLDEPWMNEGTRKRLALQQTQCRTNAVLRALAKEDTHRAGMLSDEVTRIYETVSPFLDDDSTIHHTTEQAVRSEWTYEGLARMHRRYRDLTHDTPIFLPWHRRFIYEMETALRQVDPTITIPYWDWSRESAAPHRSIAFRHFGSGAGSGGDNGMTCVPDGPFAAWSYSPMELSDDRGCILRSFDSDTGTSPDGVIYPRQCVDALIQQSLDIESFSRRWVFLHNNFHWWIGGLMGDTRYSAYDPIFYLHHAFIDKTWIDFLRERGSTYHDSNGDLPGFENLPDAGCVEYLAPRAGIRPESAKTGVHSNGTTGPARLPRTPFFELGQMQMPVVMFQRQLDGIQELCG